MQTYTFDSAKSSFFSVLRNRVNDYFALQKLHPAGNHTLVIKSALLLLSATSLYVLLVFFTPAAWISLPLCLLLGLNLALIGFNVMHDGGHQSFSKYRWVNSLAAHVLNVLGGNAYFWKVKHNINHHTFTNVEGMDSDIDVKPFMRLHEGQPWRPYHRFQYLYWVILYGISYLAWIFYEDFQKYFTRRISKNSQPGTLTTAQHLVFWGTKLFYLVFYLALPIYTVGWLPWAVGFFTITFVCGLVISVVFQLAHVVKGTQFPDPITDNRKQEWAVHQVQTTADFAPRNRVLHWLLGGLNFQIEHHLFPQISHIHYPAISRFVKQTCREYNIVYLEYSSILSAIASHVVLLYRLGRTRLA